MFVHAFLHVALLFLASSCPLQQRKWDGLRERKWDGLRVTWDRDVSSPRAFASLPRTEGEALTQGFRKLSECSESSSVRGRRYVKGDDYAVVLLYDVNGYIAGMQAGMDKALPNGYPYQELQPPFLADGNRFFITAYFVDPAMICSGGRTAQMFERDGTGTVLYIQNGTDPVLNSLPVPKSELEVQRTSWIKGKCFRTMGVHYWYNVRQDMSCRDFFPVFLLYNGGELTAFGWAFGANLSSDRFEHPPPSSIAMFFETVPKCLLSMELSTMHIYLTNHPELDNC